MDTTTFGVPCGNLKKVWRVDIPCTSEAQCFALAVGAYLAGKNPHIQIQNSGLGGAVDVVTSLYIPYGIPLPTLDLGYRHLPAHHTYMGEITKDLLKLLKYPMNKITFHEREGK